MIDPRKTYRVPLGSDGRTTDLLLLEQDVARYPGAVLIDDNEGEKAARPPRNKARAAETK
ncbi:hypothetical protein [Corynebacterium doosanense]|uniref:Uncharacterized protein n=1 Tax=Corynebacterium doosanense CAU 212 = DSM 45436 TaxID=558173 RepID=A0A097IJ63_9CORY|nr:hypothetical protein [Corynebacterium doosanense]AIT62181.1 hypothetical protein CDOO_01945 [Corynebacterium doosanense CAU 212 = DSM 45436]